MVVIFYGSARDYTDGAKSIEIEVCKDLWSLIDCLGARFGGEFKDTLSGGEKWLFLVNGKGIVTTGGLNTPLKQGDKVEVLSIVEAG